MILNVVADHLIRKFHGRVISRGPWPLGVCDHETLRVDFRACAHKDGRVRWFFRHVGDTVVVLCSAREKTVAVLGSLAAFRA